MNHINSKEMYNVSKTHALYNAMYQDEDTLPALNGNWTQEYYIIDQEAEIWTVSITFMISFLYRFWNILFQ